MIIFQYTGVLILIKSINETDLPDCLNIFHQGYETVAVEFGLTDDNCPDRGRANLPIEKLISDYKNGKMMFGYYLNDKIVGFLGMKMSNDMVCKLDDIIIIPEHRHKGYGTELLIFCKQKAKKLGATKVTLGMIDDNKILRKWYEDNGFCNIGYKKYDGAPFTVGNMECAL